MSEEIDFSAEMQELANVIAQYAPENWVKLSTNFEFYSPNDYGIDSYAIVSGKEDSEPIDFDEEDIDALEKIFTEIRNKSIEEWKVATFECTSDGDCELNFEF